MNTQRLILASSSPYRRELLSRLQLEFDCISPDCDETALENESPQAMAGRLAALKAQTVAKNQPNALIIGSDQVVESESQILRKPGDHARSFAQLSQLSGKIVNFHAGLCLFDAKTGQSHLAVETVEVKFKPLSAETIESYLKAEEPYDCAGSFKSEGLGISLFEYIRSDDPTTLVGLPLIRLCQFLELEDVKIV